MKQNRKTLIILLASVALLISCGVAVPKETYLTAKVFQTLSENEGLALNEHNEVIKIVTYQQSVHDGLTFKGYCIVTGHVRQEIKENRVKTIPVYMKVNEYRTHAKPNAQDR